MRSIPGCPSWLIYSHVHSYGLVQVTDSSADHATSVGDSAMVSSKIPHSSSSSDALRVHPTALQALPDLLGLDDLNVRAACLWSLIVDGVC